MTGPGTGEPGRVTADEVLGRRPRRRLARWGAGLVLALVVATGAVFGSRIGLDPRLVDSPLIGTPAPTRAVPLLEEPGGLSLGDLRGRVVVVNFWASWCVPCRQEHPALLAAAAAYRDAGVTVVGVSYQDRPEAAVGFLDELGRGQAPGYRYVTDPGSALAVGFGVFGIPETFLVDRDGVVVGKITGAVSLPVLAGAVDEVLAGRAPGSRAAGAAQPAPPDAGGPR